MQLVNAKAELQPMVSFHFCQAVFLLLRIKSPNTVPKLLAYLQIDFISGDWHLKLGASQRTVLHNRFSSGLDFRLDHQN